MNLNDSNDLNWSSFDLRIDLSQVQFYHEALTCAHCSCDLRIDLSRIQ